MMYDPAYFSRLCYEAEVNKVQKTGGINTMGEKRLHQVLKRYYESDETRHEQPVGRFIADVLRDEEIIEVQTGSFFPLKAKIAYYLHQTSYRITIVHPILQKKWVSWIDPEKGSVSKRRCSPKKGRLIEETRELVYLLDCLPTDRLRFIFPVIEAEDYRLLNGWSRDRKRGSTRYTRIPLALLGEETLAVRADYAALLPSDLPDPFTAHDFASAANLASRPSYAVIKVLCAVGAAESGEKMGRCQTWQRGKCSGVM